MPIGWMTALKVIPWGDVIEATPGIVKGARKMFARTQTDEPGATTGDVSSPATPGDLTGRVAALEASLAQMAERQKASAQLIETLAEQNARIVEAVEILRLRTRLLIGVSMLLAAGLVLTVVFGVFGVWR